MKVEYINPFIESVTDLYATMLQTKALRGSLSLTREDGVHLRFEAGLSTDVSLSSAR